jgi:NTE family protein
LRKEIEGIEAGRRMARDGFGFAAGAGRRLRRHRFHLIEGDRYISRVGQASAMTPNWELLAWLRDSGRRAATSWLGRSRDAIGRRSTVDLAAKFL